jgi:hypothetical protein
MKKVRRITAAATMMVMMLFGTTFAHAGIIIAGKESSKTRTTSTSPCNATSTREGIIIAGFTGIIIAGFTGIIIAGAIEPSNCREGIIIAGREGIIIAG